jgi:hypothetical protein
MSTRTRIWTADGETKARQSLGNSTVEFSAHVLTADGETKARLSSGTRQSLGNSTVMALDEEFSAHVLTADIINLAGRYICQQPSVVSFIIFEENSYHKEKIRGF